MRFDFFMIKRTVDNRQAFIKKVFFMVLYVGSTIYIKNVEKLFSQDYIMFSKKMQALYWWIL